jgi:agmatine/peptidylarginine deiminase
MLATRRDSAGARKLALALMLAAALAPPAFGGSGDDAMVEGPSQATANPHPTDEPGSLPIYLTPDELNRLDEIGTGHRATDPPTAVPRNCAEWEPLQGVLIRYPLGLPWNLIRDFADHTLVYVLVSSSSYSSAVNAFTNAGVNMDHVDFLIMSTNSIWTRDYGPWFVFDGDGVQGIIDHIYNRPRPLDDLVNWNLGPILGVEVYGTDLIHAGGNYMTDGHGIAFSTDLLLDENPGLSEAEIDAVVEDYLGVHSYHIVPDILVSGIHHIDCWAKLLDEETILVKRVDPSRPEYDDCEAAAAHFGSLTTCYGRPYRVVRIYCPPISGGVAAYTNSLILNDRVYVPLFGTAYDDDALTTYESAMPGYNVVGYTGEWLSDDAIHCRGMGIADSGMLYVDHAPLREANNGEGGYRVAARIIAHSGAGLDGDSLLVRWRRFGDINWQDLVMTAAAGPDSFETFIPEQPVSSLVQYYVSAVDESGRRTARPWVAPDGWFAFLVMPESVAIDEASSAPMSITFASLSPNPITAGTVLGFDLARTGPVSIDVYSADGRRVRRVLDGAVLSSGRHHVPWNAHGTPGDGLGQGVYWIQLSAGAQRTSVRAIIVR